MFPVSDQGIFMGFTAETKTYNAGKAVTPTEAKRNAGVS